MVAGSAHVTSPVDYLNAKFNASKDTIARALGRRLIPSPSSWTKIAPPAVFTGYVHKSSYLYKNDRRVYYIEYLEESESGEYRWRLSVAPPPTTKTGYMNPLTGDLFYTVADATAAANKYEYECPQ